MDTHLDDVKEFESSLIEFGNGILKNRNIEF